MPIEVPPWVTARSDAADLIDEHGRLLLMMFRDYGHLQSFLATGSMSLPESLKRATAIRADPIRSQHKILQDRRNYARSAIRNAQRKIAAAHADLNALGGCLSKVDHENLIRVQTARIDERTAALKGAEVDLELFRLFHPEVTKRRH